MFNTTSCLILLLIQAYLRDSHAARIILPETRLRAHLFEGYDPHSRPVLNQAQPMDITTHLHLLTITSVNEKDHTMLSRVWLDIKWNDFRLTWNVSDYDDIDNILVSKNDVWKPDIVIRNEVGNTNGLMEGELAEPLIYSNGDVVLWPGKKIMTMCRVDTSKYPFDSQICSLEIGKWYYGDNKVDIYPQESSVDLHFYSESEQWRVVNTTVDKKVYDEYGIKFSRIHYNLFLTRRPLYILLNVIIPLMTLSFLNQMCFFLPIESGEKIGMCMAIFLTFAVFLSLVSKSLPKSSIQFPAFGIYLVIQTVLSGITIASEVLVLHIYNIGSKSKSYTASLLSWLCKTNKECCTDNNLRISLRHDKPHQEETTSEQTTTENEEIEDCHIGREKEQQDDSFTLPRDHRCRRCWVDLAISLDRFIGCMVLCLNLCTVVIFFVYVNV